MSSPRLNLRRKVHIDIPCEVASVRVTDQFKIDNLAENFAYLPYLVLSVLQREIHDFNPTVQLVVTIGTLYHISLS